MNNRWLHQWRRALAMTSALITVLMAGLTLPAQAAAPTLWGVDSVTPITPAFLASIQSAYGTPDFFGRYLGGRYALTASEVAVAASQGIRLLLADQIPTSTHQVSGYATGQSEAQTAVANAQALGVPTGVAIFVDFETNDAMDTPFIEGWYDALQAAGYLPGYYANTVNGHFNSTYCAAVSADATYATAIIWSSEPEPGRSTKAAAPAFNPKPPPCAARTLLWQYGEAGAGASGPNVDTDEASSSLPLWDPASSAVGVPGAPTGVVATAANTFADVTWNAPGNDGGSVITSYTVTAAPSSGPSVTTTTAGTSARLTGLANGTAYAVTVTATNASGTGPPSIPLSVTATAGQAPTFRLGTAVIAAGQTTKVVVHGDPGGTVQVLVRGAGASADTTIGTLTLNSAGDAALPVSPGTTSSYLLRSARGDSARQSLLVKAVQSLAVQARGRTGTFTGHVAPSIVGRTVTVYWYVEGGHVQVAGRTRVVAGGQYRVTHVFPPGERIKVFAQTDADSYNAAGRSPLKMLALGR